MLLVRAHTVSIASSQYRHGLAYGTIAAAYHLIALSHGGGPETVAIQSAPLERDALASEEAFKLRGMPAFDIAQKDMGLPIHIQLKHLCRFVQSRGSDYGFHLGRGDDSSFIYVTQIATFKYY